MGLPLECHSQYSIQEGYCTIKDLVRKAIDAKCKAVALTDTNSVSGAIEFLQEVESCQKKGASILPIIGCQFITDQGKKLVLARSKKGFHNILKCFKDFETDSSGDHSIKMGSIFPNSEDLIYIGNTQAECAEIKNSWSGEIFCKEPGKFPYLDFNPIYYLEESDKLYQNIILCSKFKCTMNYISVPDEYTKFFDQTFDFKVSDKSDDSDHLVSLISQYSLAEQPNMPLLSDNPDEELTQLCRDGWKALDLNSKGDIKHIYVERIKRELDIFKQAGLSNYFLIIKDIVDFIRANGSTASLRGSGGGCLTSYLLGISRVDPICPDPLLPYDPGRELIFSRFFNAARVATKSLPDIDLDMPAEIRPKVIEYIKSKYGEDCVGHIITFARLDGRGVIKEVFRILDSVENPFQVADNICKHMIDSAKAQEELEDLREDNPGYTILDYNIEHVDKVKEFYKEYKDIFDIARKLTSCIKNTGKHAAGLVISPKPLYEYYPAYKDKKTSDNIVAYEMADLEYAGGVKYDLLSVAAYDKIDAILRMINGNQTEVCTGN